VSELALAYMIEDGELEAHIRKMHRRYEIRRGVFLEAIGKHLGDELSFIEPSGGSQFGREFLEKSRLHNGSSVH